MEAHDENMRHWLVKAGLRTSTISRTVSTVPIETSYTEQNDRSHWCPLGGVHCTLYLCAFRYKSLEEKLFTEKESLKSQLDSAMEERAKLSKVSASS